MENPPLEQCSNPCYLLWNHGLRISGMVVITFGSCFWGPLCAVAWWRYKVKVFTCSWRRCMFFFSLWFFIHTHSCLTCPGTWRSPKNKPCILALVSAEQLRFIYPFPSSGFHHMAMARKKKHIYTYIYQSILSYVSYGTNLTPQNRSIFRRCGSILAVRFLATRSTHEIRRSCIFKVPLNHRSSTYSALTYTLK